MKALGCILLQALGSRVGLCLHGLKKRQSLNENTWNFKFSVMKNRLKGNISSFKCKCRCSNLRCRCNNRTRWWWRSCWAMVQTIRGFSINFKQHFNLVYLNNKFHFLSLFYLSIPHLLHLLIYLSLLSISPQSPKNRLLLEVDKQKIRNKRQWVWTVNWKQDL